MQAELQPGAVPLTQPPAKPREDKHADAFRIVDARFVAAAAPGSSLPAPTTAEIAFAGRSNVGKSSLINSLVQRKNLVRTSSTPGSTRQVNVYEARAADGTLTHLVDLPGYGFTRRSKAEMAAWAKLVENYLEHRVTLAAVAILVDVRRGVEDDDIELIDFMKSATAATRRPVQVLVIATKLDKLPRSSRKVELQRIRATSKHPVFGYSAVTAEGRDELWRALRRAALGHAEAHPESVDDEPTDGDSEPSAPAES